MRFLATTLRTRSYPWFVLAAVLVVVAVAALSGTAQSIVGSAAFFVFLFAFMRRVALGVRDDEVESDVATRWVTGVLLTEYASARRRRRAARARRRASTPPGAASPARARRGGFGRRGRQR